MPSSNKKKNPKVNSRKTHHFQNIMLKDNSINLVNNSKFKKKIPLPIKLISILYYIAAAFTILIGAILILSGIFSETIINKFGIENLLNYGAETFKLEQFIIPLILDSLILGGIIFIFLALAEIFISRSLWNGKNWARYTIILFSALGALNSLFFFDIFTLTISLVIGLYLILSLRAKLFFLNSNTKI